MQVSECIPEASSGQQQSQHSSSSGAHTSTASSPPATVAPPGPAPPAPAIVTAVLQHNNNDLTTDNIAMRKITSYQLSLQSTAWTQASPRLSYITLSSGFCIQSDSATFGCRASKVVGVTQSTQLSFWLFCLFSTQLSLFSLELNPATYLPVYYFF